MSINFNDLSTPDINECYMTMLPVCDSRANCTNTIGSFLCSCNVGYRGNGIGISGCSEEWLKCPHFVVACVPPNHFRLYQWRPAVGQWLHCCGRCPGGESGDVLQWLLWYHM